MFSCLPKGLLRLKKTLGLISHTEVMMAKHYDEAADKKLFKSMMKKAVGKTKKTVMPKKKAKKDVSIRKRK